METWLLAGLLGLGLAAATGLKTFLPLLMLSAAARFDLFGIELSGAFAWLSSDAALVALGVAALAEFLADKIPVVDHALSAFGTIARPAAGALAAAAAFSGLDPAMAAILGLIVGAPTALAFNTAQTGARLTSTAATGGVANPLVSFAEDALAFVTAGLALAAPLLVPVALLLLVVGGLVVLRRLTRRFRPSAR